MTLYLDTSSIVKLYVEEVGRDDVKRLLADAAVVFTSQVAYPQTRSALARRRREGHLSAASFGAAKKDFEADWTLFARVETTAVLCAEAGELAERYELRGFDSIHLASFAEMVRALQGADDVQFSSFDDRLNIAARKLARRLR